MELWDAGTTAFWACVVEPGRPHECTVPSGVELRLKGACVAAGAKRKAAATLTVSAEDDSTTSIVARLGISSDRENDLLLHCQNGTLACSRAEDFPDEAATGWWASMWLLELAA